jgi:hypothetical protein
MLTLLTQMDVQKLQRTISESIVGHGKKKKIYPKDGVRVEPPWASSGFVTRAAI